MKRTLTSILAISALALVACEDRTTSNQPTGSPSGTTTNNNAATRTPQGATRTPDTANKPPDNTGVNKRDRNDQTLTPGDQTQGSEADRKITADVRRAITDDSSLSMNAHNVKIITLNGIVTLRGPVESQAEKDAVEAKAKAIAGVTSVDNQLEVKP